MNHFVERLLMKDKTTCVSVRLRTNDLIKIKSIAKRLQTNDSDVMRFAIKTVLNWLTPLIDDLNCGYRALPVFVEHGIDLVRHFDLDVEQLMRIINSCTTDDDCSDPVARTDLELIVLSATSDDYLKARFKEIAPEIDTRDSAMALRDYLYRKYGLTSDETDAGGTESVSRQH
jgi:hypothetical protein